jgi:hypothetical protein
MNDREFEQALGRPLLSRDDFVSRVRTAIAERIPFSTGKLGVSERALLQYPLLLEDEPDAARRRAYEVSLAYKALSQSGVFPADPGFYREWGALLADSVRQHDCVGLFPDAHRQQLELLRRLEIGSDVLIYLDQEPDRSPRADDARCWLPSLKGRRLLLVHPFAELLRSRADRETFEAVWAKTGKRWFDPAAVDALEFPYGTDPATHERFPTARDLLDEITDDIARRDFDVALIGAGGLGDPIAAFVKGLGKVGFCLGGHTQVLFGVIGDRWRDNEEWQRDYFNDAWISTPEDSRPDQVPAGEHYW